MIKACLAFWKQLTASETVKPTTHLLDNEASEEFRAEIRKIVQSNSYLQTTTNQI
jgi:hypothetical protein